MLQLPGRGLRHWILNLATVTPIKSRSYGTIGANNSPKVSTTRGSPSTSVDLKEAVREKIPLHYDMLRKFRSQHGSSVISQITVNDMYDGLKGINTLVRETSEVDPRFGIRYRGLTLPEVLVLLPRRGKAPSPEAIFWLLLTGDVPTHEQTASLMADWTIRRQRRKNCWLDSDDGHFISNVIRSLPRNVNPLGRLSIALTVLDAMEKNIKASGPRTMSYNYWEQTYEEGMELLAILPAIVGLARDVDKNIKGKATENEGDWVDFFLEHFLSDTIDERNKASFGDFLRLYITANADDDGGTPSSHVMQILGSSCTELSKALGTGVLAFTDQPTTGTMFQCMKFQEEIKHLLGREPSEEALKNLLGGFFEKENEIIGHSESLCDSRYEAFLDFAREHIVDDPEVKLSREISRILGTIARSCDRNLSPEQSVLTAPIFRFYGLRDMEFNQTLLFMARALGAIASIIWARAIDVPIENPKSRCTYTYVDLFRNGKTMKTRKLNSNYTKRLQK